MEKTNETFQILNYFSTFAIEMAGIYIHIPFCKSRCIYCGFYSTTSLQQRQRYVDAVCHEMVKRTTDSAIGTIYLGGGTPSQLTLPQLHQLFDALYNIYNVDDDAEITIEMNPDDVTPEMTSGLSALPVNRVSMGAQTFDDQRLRFLNRRHNACQVSKAVSQLRQAGISNISIDLMYGFPDESIEAWNKDIDCALALDVEHLSAYCLMIEEGTELFELMNKEKKTKHDEETERQMYYTLIDRLTGAGFEHYEISNFARPGRRSRHNSSYWTDVPYIGLGAAAHSYDGQRRQWNVSNLEQYIQGVELDTPCAGYEDIDPTTRFNDRIMLALRTCEGLELSALDNDDRRYVMRQADKYLRSRLLAIVDDRLALTRQGLFVSDMIMSDLMKEN